MSNRVKGYIRALLSGPVVVLIDAENMPVRYLPQIIDAASSAGLVREVRAYGPRALMVSDAWEVASAAYKVKRVVCAGCRAGKNSSDISLAVDAMELLSKRKFATFAIASDDTDFSPLARKLRQAGRKAMGIGRLSNNVRYKESFDEFRTVGAAQVLVKDETSAQLPERILQERAATCGIDVATLALAVECVARGAREDKWCSASDFGVMMRKERPTFSCKKYGCKNLTRFAEKTGVFDVKKIGGSTCFRIRAA